MPQPQKLGQQGENIACKFLQKKGYILLKQNYRYLKAEIDLIMQIDNTVVIVEVKTRSSTYFGMPETFLKPQQIQRLISAADHYIISKGLDVNVRFDIVTVVQKQGKIQIEHIENAFYHF